MVGKIQTRLTGDKMDKDTVESFLHELEEFQGRIPSAARSEWSKADQRQWASDVNAVRKSLIKLRRKANPCVGFHFHGKDADELLKAIEKSNERQLKGAPKKNPTKKKVAKRRRNPALRPKEKSLLFNVARHAPYSKRLAHKKFGKETANSLLKSELIESAADAYVPGSKGFDVVNEFAPLSTREEDVWEAEVDHSAIRRALRGNPKKNPAKKKVAKKKVAKKNPVPSVRIGSEFNGWKLSSKTPVTLTIKPLDIRGEVVHNLVVVDPVSGAGKNRVYALYDEAGSFTGERVVRPKTEWNSQLDTATKWANRTIGLSRSNPSAPGKKKVAKKTTRKKTPEWQLLCNRCAKLWDHYCERPSKARLKPVLDHLEKMKGSTSKKVADERKACLRVAKKEARRLKMK